MRAGKIGMKVGKVINKYKVGKYLETEITENSFPLYDIGLSFVQWHLSWASSKHFGFYTLNLIQILCKSYFTFCLWPSTLIRRGKTVKNQLGRETHSPTLRWIFQQFQAIHLLTIKGENEISNLTQERLNLLQFFPKPCQQYYLLV